MGGNGSGRKSVKGEAIFCLLDVQLIIQRMIHEGFDTSKTREELKDMAVEAIKQIKVAQEEIERI